MELVGVDADYGAVYLVECEDMIGVLAIMRVYIVVEFIPVCFQFCINLENDVGGCGHCDDARNIRRPLLRGKANVQDTHQNVKAANFGPGKEEMGLKTSR